MINADDAVMEDGDGASTSSDFSPAAFKFEIVV